MEISLSLSLSLILIPVMYTSDCQKPKNATPLSLSLSLMATRFSLYLLLVALTISTLLRPISTSTSTSPPSSSPPTTATIPPPHSPSKPTSPPPPNPSSPPPPPSLPTLLESIISALLGAGDFRHWATLLSATDSSTLPPLTTATLFIPSDQALSHFPTTTTTPFSSSFDPFLIPYHIIPQRLPFSALQLFQTLTRLPTLLPSNSILITSHSNFSVDGSRITHPDLYVNSAVAVHGVDTVLDYSIYGSGPLSPPPPPVTKNPEPAPYFPCHGRRSDAAGLGCNWFRIVFGAVCAAFAFNIS